MIAVRPFLVALLGLLALAPGASAEQAVEELSFTASDGVRLYATVSGEAPLRPRPLIVEYAPYGLGPGGPPAGPAFNYVQVHARGTGRSEGAWNIMGAREQADIAESLRWLCDRPWSSGRIGLYGFSASAIAAYHALRRPQLPCVKTAALLAGTSSIYRDLIFIGGMPNLIPGFVVSTGIGGGFVANFPGRFGDRPQSMFQAGGGITTALSAYAAHTTQDAFWREREFPGSAGVPEIPILVATGFYDVESRGPFETFRALGGTPSHLLLIGAHDGAAGGTRGAQPQFKRWFERYLLGVQNGIDEEPTVQLYVGHGSHAALRRGEWSKLEAPRWPVPGTAWRALYFDARKSGSARSLNDGTLAATRPATAVTQTGPTIPSNTFATDPNTTATVTNVGTMNFTERQALTYTTAPLSRPVMSVGPAALKVRLKSTSPETDIVAVLSDVTPDGTSNPVAVGRLRSTFTGLDRSRSRTDPRTGAIVQPYNDLSAKQQVPPLSARDYHVEFWPIGNRFARGHRIRLSLVGTPGSFQPSVPALNSIVVGGPNGAALQFPTLPGSDLCGAIGAPPCPTPGRVSAERCLARRSPIGPRNIGRVRLGATRRRLERIPVRIVRRTSFTRVFCVRGTRRRVVAVFAETGRRSRAKLIVTRAPNHRMRGVGARSRERLLRRRFPGRVRLAGGVVRARPGSRRLFGLRRARVRWVAVGDKRVIRNRSALRRALRRSR